MVGEAPGTVEVKQGRGFVGPAGQIMWRMGSNTLKFKREDFSCTNALKCRPPNNDFELAGMKGVGACRPALLKEIELAKPSVILAVGDKALKALEIPGKISLLQGHMLEWRGHKLLPMFHPSYYIHNKEQRVYDAIWECLTQVVGYKESRKGKRVPFKDYEGEEIPEHIVLDVENDVGGSLVCVGFRGVVANLQHAKRDTRQVLQLVSTDGQLPSAPLATARVITGHHARNDYRELRGAGLIPAGWSGVLEDTIGYAQLINENRENFELKSWAGDYGYGTYWIEIHKHWNRKVGSRKVPEDPPLPKLRAYNAKDVALTDDIRRDLRRELEKDPLLVRYHDCFFVHALKHCAEIELNGIYISPEVKKAEPKLKRRIRYRHRKMTEKVRELGLEPPEGTWKGNFQQDLIFDKLKMSPVRLTKTKRPGVDRASLIELEKKDPTGLVKRYVELSSLGKQDEILQQLLGAAGGYAHPSFNLGGRGSKTLVEETKEGKGSPVTGRLSANDPNSQQMPKWIRVYFISRYGEDGIILSADAKQIEIRVAYCYSGDPAFLVSDVHSQTRDVMNALGIVKEIRDRRGHPKIIKRVFSRDEGKTCNFAVIYGAEVGRLMEAFGLSEKEAVLLRSGLREKYALHFEWYDELVRQVKLDGQVRSLTGRIRRLPLARGGKGQGHALKQAANFPIQNMASDMTILCALGLGARGPGWTMWNLVHDEIDIDCQSEMVAKRLAKRIHRYWQLDLAKDVKDAFGYDLPCEFQVELSMGPNWRDLEEIAA